MLHNVKFESIKNPFSKHFKNLVFDQIEYITNI